MKHLPNYFIKISPGLAVYAIAIILAILITLFNSCNYTHNNKINKNDTILNGHLPNHNCNDTIIFSKVSKDTNSKFPWRYEWNKYIANELKAHKKTFIGNDTIYKTDINKLSPNYYTLTNNQKYAWWTLLIASISYYESNFNPNCRFKEPVSLNYVYSEGLLQLSYTDKEIYKNCLIDSNKQNILNPEVNLKTGVIIMARQLQNRKCIFTKKFFYWSVLTKKQKEIIVFFQKNIAEL